MMQIMQETRRQKRKNTSEGCHFTGANLISWMTKKNLTIALCVVEAKYISDANYCSQLP